MSKNVLSKARSVQFANSARSLAPGVTVCLLVAMAAVYLSEHYGGPVMLFALLLGMALHFLSEEGQRTAEGIQFCAKKILRVGVALLGFRISIEEIIGLGWETAALILGGVVSTIFIGILLAHFAGRSRAFGVLTGGAVAICGASAALAISSVLPQSRKNETNTLFTVIAVTTLSTIAMVFYPAIGGLFAFDDVQMGIFLGATIHDVAQVVGAGYSVSDQAGDTATIVKLLRVALLVPVVVIIAYAFRNDPSRTSASRLPVPGFAIAFAIFVIIHSIGVLPAGFEEILNSLSRWCLITAIAALGMLTSLKALSSVGFRSVALVTAETVILMGLVIAALLWLMG